MHGLEGHVGINAERVKMTVRNGWVTLEGTVDWPYQKILAQSVVKSLKGVVGITNNIEYRGAILSSLARERQRSALVRLLKSTRRLPFLLVDGSAEPERPR
jgi:hypothetical protein